MVRSVVCLHGDATALKGKDLEKTGVKPDIYVKNTFLDRVESKDPQLERAVKEIIIFVASNKKYVPNEREN